MSSDQFYNVDLAILRVSARLVSQAPQQAEDIALMEGDQS